MSPSQANKRRLAIAAELLELEATAKSLSAKYNKLQFEDLRLKVVERIGLAGVAFCRIDLWKSPPNIQRLHRVNVCGTVYCECVILEVHRVNAIIQYQGSGKYRAAFDLLFLAESGVAL